MSNNGNSKRHTTVLLIAVVASLTLFGCANVGTDSSSSMNANGNANAMAGGDASAKPEAGSIVLEAREPDRYSVTTTIMIQPTGNAPQANIPQVRFSFAKSGIDQRRLSFALPEPVGEVIYLEREPHKYLIFPARNRYVELDAKELGFRLGDLMSPAAVIDRLKERTSYEKVGTETVSGRPAVKYRFAGTADTRTQAGTVAAESVVYVDQQTGLPLRSEIDTTLSSGAGARIVTSAEAIDLMPEASQFEVPVGMKKVTSAELKQQVQGFVSTLRVFAEYMRRQSAPQADRP